MMLPLHQISRGGSLTTRIAGSLLAPLAVLVAALAPAMPARAADGSLPEAEQILDRFVEVTGGKAAYAKLRNRITVEDFTIASMELKTTRTRYAARPNRLYVEIEMEGQDNIVSGTDGKVFWKKNPMDGPILREGEDLALARRASLFDGTAQWRELFKKARCVSIESVGGHHCYRVILTPHEGPEETRYYDRASGLLAKTEVTVKVTKREFLIETFSSDYKEVDGVQLPHKILRVTGKKQKMLYEVQSIRHNVEMPEGRFELPADIKAHVSKKTSKMTERRG